MYYKFVITQTKSVRYSCKRVWPRPNPQGLSPDSNFLYLKALYYPGWRRTGPFKSVQSCRNRDCSSINFNWSFSWNNHTIIWRIVAKNLVHSDPYSKINLALSRNEIIVFHEIVWQSNNLQRYRSYDVNIPLWEGNQAADTFSQLSKWNRSPVSVGAIDAIYI